MISVVFEAPILGLYSLAFGGFRIDLEGRGKSEISLCLSRSAGPLRQPKSKMLPSDFTSLKVSWVRLELRKKSGS